MTQLIRPAGREVAATARLWRIRQAQVDADYLKLAGVSRGRRMFYDWSRRRWCVGHVIDLGRRPETGRKPAQPKARRLPKRPPTEREYQIMTFFAGRDNRKASGTEIAQAIGCAVDTVYRTAHDSDYIAKIHVPTGRPGGQWAYAATIDLSAGVPLPASVQRAVSILEGGPLNVRGLAKAMGVVHTVVDRLIAAYPDLFDVTEHYNGKQKQLIVSLKPAAYSQ